MTTTSPANYKYAVIAPDGEPATKAMMTRGKPTWCPGCGFYSVLSAFFSMIEEKKLPRNKIVCVAGIGCSSRFPYFVNGYGVQFIHGRALPFATGLALSRPDLHVFVFSGDGDAFSIGGNHFHHSARRNVHLTLVVMDNNIYGLTKKQTSPTTPIGCVTTTDPFGVKERQINAMQHILTSGATFVARSAAHQPKHVKEMLTLAHSHQGFSVIETLCECRNFMKGQFDVTDPKKDGQFKTLPDDHDATNINAALAYAEENTPGYFGVFYNVRQPSRNELECDLIRSEQAKYNRPVKTLMKELLTIED